MIFQRHISILLLAMFMLLSGYETIEFFSGESIKGDVKISGVFELEEENNTSEESKEEKDEELKFEDELFIEPFSFSTSDFSLHEILAINEHFHSSDYSSRVFCPPEFI